MTSDPPSTDEGTPAALLLFRADELLSVVDVPRGRLLALDVGERRTGVAVCDELRLSVRPLATLQRGKNSSAVVAAEELVARIVRLIDEQEARAVVLGYPLRADGSVGEAALKLEEFAARLSDAARLPVYLQDERYTSIEAEMSLRDRGRRRSKDRRDLIDGEAAAIILRDFLSRLVSPYSPRSPGDEQTPPEVF